MSLFVKILALFPVAIFSILTPAKSKESADVVVNKDSLVSFSKAQLGKNYNYANCSPKTGFDCSGFVYYVFTHFKVNVPRSSSEYSNFGREVPMDSSQTGDVIVFTGTNAAIRKPGHVGIVLTGGSELNFIHSSSDKRTPGVKISDFKASPNYKKRFIKIVRVCRVI